MTWACEPLLESGGTRAVRGLHCALWVLCGSLERPPGRQRDVSISPTSRGPAQASRTHTGLVGGHGAPPPEAWA